MKVKVETRRTRYTLLQCHRYQDYGHSQEKCNENHKSVKCGQLHLTKDCKKPADVPDKINNNQKTYPSKKHEYQINEKTKSYAAAVAKPKKPNNTVKNVIK